MICPEHRGGGFTAGGGPCPECANRINSAYKLCERCSTGFDQCEICRKPLNSGRSLKLIAAFNSSEAARARRALVDAEATKKEAYRAAAKIVEEAAAPAAAQLKSDIQPHRDQLTSREQPFADEYMAVCEEQDAIERDPASTAGQKLDARNRWSAAMSKCSRECRPLREQFEEAVAPLRARYEEQVAPFKAVQKAACILADERCKIIKVQANADLDRILKRAVSPAARFASWLSGLVGG